MNKVNQKSVLEVALPAVGGGVAAAFATNAIGKAIKAPTTKNESYKKAGIHAVIAVISGYAYLALNGNDAASKAGRAAGLVGAVTNTLAVVSTLVNSSDKATQALAADTAVNKLIRNGLGCPCEAGNNYAQLNRPHRRRALRMPVFAPDGSGASFEEMIAVSQN